MTTERIYQQTPPNVQLSTLVTEIGTLNGDMTTAQAAIAALQAYNTPVAWDGVHDRVLGVGQHTVDSFTSATSMPLHIACGDGQIYEINIAGTYTAAASKTPYAALQPNNTTYASAFYYKRFYADMTAGRNAQSASIVSAMQLDDSGTSMRDGEIKIFTSTLTKQIHAKIADASSAGEYLFFTATRWMDTITVWSSLGTVVMPNSWTGTITTKRIA